jgi:DNA-binding transcriptional MerR regulator
MYKISEMAKKVRVSTQTLRNWDRDGIFVAKRYPSGERFYTEEQMQELLKGEKKQK